MTTTLARTIRNTVVQQSKDPYHMELSIVLQDDDDEEEKMVVEHHRQKFQDRTTQKDDIHYNPYGRVTPTPERTAMMTASLRQSLHIQQAASAAADDGDDEISDRDVIDWPTTISDDDRGVENKNTYHDNPVVDMIESKQDDDYLYRNAQYLHHHSKSTRQIVNPTQRGPPAIEINTTATPALTTREKLDEAERHLKVLESNVTLHKRLGQLEDQLRQRDSQLQLLQNQFEQLLKHSRQQDQQLRRLQQQQRNTTTVSQPNEEWDAAVVTWKIPKFEKMLTTARHFFESSPFQVSSYALFYLTVCVLEVEEDVPESKRPVAIFLKAKTTTAPRGDKHPDEPSIFPIRMDGSKITLVSNHHDAEDKTVQVGETQMKDASQGKGVRQFTTLGTLRKRFVQDDASVVVRATVRVPRTPIYWLKAV